MVALTLAVVVVIVVVVHVELDVVVVTMEKVDLPVTVPPASAASAWGPLLVLTVAGPTSGTDGESEAARS